MDLRHLRTFVVCAERLHFREAARRLFLSQPTVTAHIQALEHELGAELFVRRGRGVALSGAGERLLPHARQMLAIEQQAIAGIAAWRLRYDEHLRLMASIFVASSALPGALRRLLAERPRLDVALRTGFSGEVAEAVAADEADLGLSRVEPALPGLACRCLGLEPVVAAAPAAWADLPLEQVLAARPLLTHNHPGYWDRLLAQLAALGLAVRPMEVRQVDVTCRLIEEGLGLSFLPRSAIAGRPGVVQLALPTGLALPEVGTWALWPRARRLPEAGDRLAALVGGAGPAQDRTPGGPASPGGASLDLF